MPGEEGNPSTPPLTGSGWSHPSRVGVAATFPVQYCRVVVQTRAGSSAADTGCFSALAVPQNRAGVLVPRRQRSASRQLHSVAAWATLPSWLSGSQRVLQGAWAQPPAPGSAAGIPSPGGFLQLKHLQRAPQLEPSGVPQRRSTAAAVRSGHLSAFCQLNEMVPLPYSRCGPC